MPLLLIIGATGIGKSFLIEEIKSLGIQPIFTYTTRPKRIDDHYKISVNRDFYNRFLDLDQIFLSNKIIHRNYYFEFRKDIESAQSDDERWFSLDISWKYLNVYLSGSSLAIALVDPTEALIRKRIEQSARIERLENSLIENSKIMDVARRMQLTTYNISDEHYIRRIKMDLISWQATDKML